MKTKIQEPGLESREAAWKESNRMFALQHQVLLDEAEQRQAMLEGIAPKAAEAGLDLKAVTAARAAAFQKVIARLEPFLTVPKGGRK